MRHDALCTASRATSQRVAEGKEFGTTGRFMRSCDMRRRTRNRPSTKPDDMMT
jgi:hypothetical protein